MRRLLNVLIDVGVPFILVAGFWSQPAILTFMLFTMLMMLTREIHEIRKRLP